MIVLKLNRIIIFTVLFLLNILQQEYVFGKLFVSFILRSCSVIHRENKPFLFHDCLETCFCRTIFVKCLKQKLFCFLDKWFIRK